jgi:hypothetical protein
VLGNKSNQRLTSLRQLSNHLYQKDNLDIIHKQKERDQPMHQNKLYQVLEEEDKIAPQDCSHQKLLPKAVKLVQFPTRKKVMAKFQNIFKR